MSALHEQNSFTKFRPSSIEGLKPNIDIGIGIDITTSPKKGFWRRFIELMDVSLLKDPGYLNILFGLSIFYVAEMNFKMVTPFFFASLGYPKTDVAYCLSVTAISDIAARIVLPPICDRFNVKKRNIFFISILFVAITRSSKLRGEKKRGKEWEEYWNKKLKTICNLITFSKYFIRHLQSWPNKPNSTVWCGGFLFAVFSEVNVFLSRLFFHHFIFQFHFIRIIDLFLLKFKSDKNG